MRFENDEDRRALITGLSLHEKGRVSLKQVALQFPGCPCMQAPDTNHIVKADG